MFGFYHSTDPKKYLENIVGESIVLVQHFCVPVCLIADACISQILIDV